MIECTMRFSNWVVAPCNWPWLYFITNPKFQRNCRTGIASVIVVVCTHRSVCAMSLYFGNWCIWGGRHSLSVTFNKPNLQHLQKWIWRHWKVDLFRLEYSQGQHCWYVLPPKYWGKTPLRRWCLVDYLSHNAWTVWARTIPESFPMRSSAKLEL